LTNAGASAPQNVFALSTARSQTPQDLADYLARWTDPNPQ